jgi:hypothetical protein
MIDFFLIDCCKFSAKNQQCYKSFDLFSLGGSKKSLSHGTAFLWIIINLYSVPCHSLQICKFFKFGKLSLNFWANSTAFGLIELHHPMFCLDLRYHQNRTGLMYSKSKTAWYLYSMSSSPFNAAAIMARVYFNSFCYRSVSSTGPSHLSTKLSHLLLWILTNISATFVVKRRTKTLCPTTFCHCMREPG